MHENEIRQIDVLSNELSQAKELIRTLESKLSDISTVPPVVLVEPVGTIQPTINQPESIQPVADGPESISVQPPPDDGVTQQLNSATAELEKIKVLKFVTEWGAVLQVHASS